jgi:oligosaccharide repeat unit polymerase
MTVNPLHQTSVNRRYENGDDAPARMVAAATPPRRPTSTTSTIIMLDGVVVVLLTLAGLVCYYGRFSVESFFRPACIIISALILWWYWSWRAFARGWFDPYTLFLTAAVLFNCGQPILEAFGLNENSLLRDHFSEEISIATLYLIALGMSALHFGVLLSTALSSSRHPETTNTDTFSEYHLRNACRVGVMLLLISCVPAVLALRDRLELVIAGGYLALFPPSAPTGLAGSLYILSDFLVPGIAFVIAGGRQNPIMRAFSLLIIVIWTAVEFFLGGRAHALMPALGMVWLWDRTVFPISRTVLIGAALLMIGVVFPLIAVTREEAGHDRLSLGRLQNAFVHIDNPVVTELSEMGGSADTIAWTMELVPSVRPFALGGTYLAAILTLVPNLSSHGLNPAMRLFGYDIPGNWLVSEVNPDLAAQGGSYGYSFIAEAYLNFGWAAPIALFIFGAVYGGVRSWTLNGNDPARMAVMGIFLSSILFFARSSLVTAVRPFFWYALFPYFLVVLLDSRSALRRVRGSCS